MALVWLVNLGLTPYREALELQHRLVAARKRGALNDTLLLLEHPPVITFGRHAREEHLLVSREQLAALGIEVFWVERGGDVTYHGPGQLVGYPILDLGRFRRDVGWYVRTLEEVLIRTVAGYGLNARRLGAKENGQRDSRLVGVWVDNPVADAYTRPVRPDAKIAQIGARIESWISYHGFALNVNPIMSHFDLIVPCGIPDKPVTSLAQARVEVSMADVRQRVAQMFQECFGVLLEPITPAALEQELDQIARVTPDPNMGSTLRDNHRD